MLSSQEQQEDRRRTMLNDARVREQTGTMHAFAVSEAATPRGRYSQVTTENVVGARADIASTYGACSPALAVQLPDEPPLGFDNPALEPSMAPPVSSVEVTDPTSADALSPLGRHADVGSFSQTDGSAPEVPFPAPGKRGDAVGPSTLRRV